MWMLMRDKPTRYHSDNDTNNMKDIHSLLKLSAHMLSSSAVVTPHPFEESCVVASLGRIWVGGETEEARTVTSGSTSTTLTTAFPSRTRRILSVSQVGVDTPFGGNCVMKACQKAPPSCWTSVCEAILASRACCGVGSSFADVNGGVVGSSFDDEGGDG